MFGILKSGIKLGIGCFVAIILLVALAAGAFFYYCGKKPATKPRNANRQRAAASGNPSADSFFQNGEGFFSRRGEG
jgi:peptidoglycan/LPS O-acetylase OafA/YrhL